jgi:hypothetical protein
MNGEKSYSEKTDADGKFTIKAAKGTYKVSVIKYVTVSENAKATPASAPTPKQLMETYEVGSGKKLTIDLAKIK